MSNKQNKKKIQENQIKYAKELSGIKESIINRRRLIIIQ